MSMVTPLAKARGLGSAHEGVGHWWVQRLTSIALVPLTLWAVASLVAAIDGGYAGARAWVGSLPGASLMILFIIANFYHAQLGLQVIMEDYIHTRWLELTLQILVKLAALFLSVLCILAVLRIALGE